jgi:hypothetical protein
MTEVSKSTTGGCMCGAVRYEAVGKPIIVGYCHCNSCRRHTGAPVVTVVIFEQDRVKFTKDDRKIYNSSPGVGRGFCDQCGSSLTWEGKYGGAAWSSRSTSARSIIPTSMFLNGNGGMMSGLPGSKSLTICRINRLEIATRPNYFGSVINGTSG